MVEFDVGVSPSGLAVHAIKPCELVFGFFSELVSARLEL